MLDKDDILLLQEMFSRQKEELRAEIRDGLRSELIALMESEVTPKFNLLAEGQQAILDRLGRMEPERRFEEIDDESVVFRAAVKQLARDVRELKKQAN